MSDIIAIAKERGEDPFIVIADEIEAPHNLGALIRTAEIAECHGLIIPKRRSAAVTEVVSKVSCGATEHLAIARVGNINDAIEINCNVLNGKYGLWVAWPSIKEKDKWIKIFNIKDKNLKDEIDTELLKFYKKKKNDTKKL